MAVKVKALDSSTVGYVAGLVDGEGTVTLTRKHKSENRALAISISNTERGILEYTLEVVGAGKITGKRRTRRHHSQAWAYAIYNRQALDLLRQITPYLRSYKRHRATLILDNYLRLTPRNGKYSGALLEARKKFEQDVLSIKP